MTFAHCARLRAAGDSYDLQEVQGGDEGTEGPHLPQEAEMAMPNLQARRDAIAKIRKVRQSVFQMIRNARESDIPRLVEIRAAVRENQLRNASLVTLADYQWFIANPGMFVWEEGSRVVGFSAADPRDGSIWALFMDQAYEGRGIAQLLFDRACSVLRNAGHKRMWLTTSAGTRAEKFCRKAGWVVVRVEGGQLRFENSES